MTVDSVQDKLRVFISLFRLKEGTKKVKGENIYVIDEETIDNFSYYNCFRDYFRAFSGTGIFKYVIRWHVVRRQYFMSSKKGSKRGMFILICVIAFVVAFGSSVLFKVIYTPAELRKYTVEWTEDVGRMYTDLSYGEKTANKFDLYVPADQSKGTYGLVVYLHAGGFTTGDKKDDEKMLQWLASLGYVAAGINYTLASEKNPNANVYTQSLEIKESIPYVVAEAERLGYKIDRMAMAGGSAGHALAMIYAYRDAKEAPVPVKLLFGGVGPSSFYPEDWTSYGFDKNFEAAAAMFSLMSGKSITSDMFGTADYDEVIRDISALLWINEETVPSVLAYGKHDKVQPYLASVRLDEALTKYNVPHEYIVFEHSGHGLQNDTKESIIYNEKIVEYLDFYMKN